MRKAFTLVEVLIMVAILGILAAVGLPMFQNHTAETRETAIKCNLSMLRGAIERYVADHKGVPPGFFEGDMSLAANYGLFRLQLVVSSDVDGRVNIGSPSSAYPLGPYISEIPENPFNGYWMPKTLWVTQDMPEEATGEYGWIYHPFEKKIRLDWPGTDSQGVRYYDY
ncbi:MAG: type II secretion system protein [Planctomycetota bacterium]|jgi:prepilin-type N-terminal cleavage/methylation domain-containing protein